MGIVNSLLTPSPMASTIPHFETCIRESDTTAWSLSTHHVGLLQSYLATIDGHRTEDPEACLGTQAANESVCRACGCGDNTIGHWTRWCPNPLIVAHAILRPGRRQSTLNSIAALSLRNTAICTLILASFRRLLRQEGAFLEKMISETTLKTFPLFVIHLTSFYCVKTLLLQNRANVKSCNDPYGKDKL